MKSYKSVFGDVSQGNIFKEVFFYFHKEIVYQQEFLGIQIEGLKFFAYKNADRFFRNSFHFCFL